MRADCVFCDNKNRRCNALVNKQCNVNCTFFETLNVFEKRQATFAKKHPESKKSTLRKV